MSQKATMFSPSTPSMLLAARPAVPITPMLSFSFGPIRAPRALEPSSAAVPSAAVPPSHCRRLIRCCMVEESSRRGLWSLTSLKADSKLAEPARQT